MRIVVDANVAIAVLDSADPFHRVALHRCLQADSVAILNTTRAEALIHPTRAGKFDAADALLDDLGFTTTVLSDSVADRTRQLLATYRNKHFPIVDAAVVALGIELGLTVVTSDDKWPEIPEATIEVLQPEAD